MEHAKDRVNWALMALGVLLVLASALFGASCATWKTRAWRTVYAVRQAGEAADIALARSCEEKNIKCKQSTDYHACIKPCAKALEGWIRFGRPSIDTSVILAVQALTLADKGIANKTDVFGAVQAAGCALLHAIEQWASIVPDKLLTNTRRLARLVCEKGQTNGSR